ncbi:unnamed protein product [Brachionus calyciflorus]|uniref:Uncharacterized protein n=1 Tax=Brachionus calyciflorus TaxID=104777 RepID=A0A814IFX4_9BILA|nr:unnamed protein product [Brachionus calyciflorus]
MFQTRNEILEYYSKMINDIDIKCEKSILTLKKEELDNQINSHRQQIIAKIEDVQKLQLNNLKNSDSKLNGPFCFFIPNSKTFYYDSKFEFKNQIGQLVVTSFILSDKITRNSRSQYNANYFEFDTFEELSKFKVISQLIDLKKDDLIIDLTQTEMNQIESLSLISYYEQLEENSLSFIEHCLNLQTLKNLKIKNYSDKLPNNFFKPFKDLIKLKLMFPDLKSISEQVFNGLENLEILELLKFDFLDWGLNTFNNLNNLKKLILNQVCIQNLSIIGNLNHLEILVMKECCIKKLSNSNTQINISSLDNLRSLESNVDLENLKISYPNLEILSLKSQSLNDVFKCYLLKFLNIRNCNTLKSINFLNDLNQLEFLDIKLPNKLTDNFELVNLSKLKFLVLTCENIPNFNESFNHLQGLELIYAKSLPRDEFVNLINLEYLALTECGLAFLNTFSTTNFQTFKQLKCLKIESDCLDIDDKNSFKESLLKLFNEPSMVLCDSSFCRDGAIEIGAKLHDEIISEKVYFKKYLQISERVREFILSNESIYFKEYFTRTYRRRSNFETKYESSDDDYDLEDNDYIDYCYYDDYPDEPDEFSGYDSD